MLARVLALAIAVLLAATCVLPALDGYRCVSMNRTLAAGEDCPLCDATLSIGNPCCELVHVASLDARASTQPKDTHFAPAPLTAVLPLSLPQLLASQTATLTCAARPRGRPPGLTLSTVLRV